VNGGGRTAAPLHPVLELNGPASLHRLRAPLTRRTVRSIVVVDPDLAPHTTARIEAQLNRWYFACGCEQGSVAVLLSLVASVLGGLLQGFDGPLAWWRILIYAAAAAFTGKLLGLGYARVRLRHLYRRLEARYRKGGSWSGTA
jgi:hypothetical protein